MYVAANLYWLGLKSNNFLSNKVEEEEAAVRNK
jgi:hypothetical protein